MTAPLTGRPRLKLPASAAVGDVIEIRTLLEHPMETGLRKTPDGQRDPARHAGPLQAKANGGELSRRRLSQRRPPPIPISSFTPASPAQPIFTFVWTHEDGRTVQTTATVAVK